MAVSTTETMAGPFTADGVATEFPFAFRAMSEAEVTVIARDISGEWVDPGGYYVDLAGEGGTVVFYMPPVIGLTLLVISMPSFTQDITFENGSAWLAAPVNNANDRSVVRDLVLKREIGQSLRYPAGELASPLPIASQRAGGVLTFDGAGNWLVKPEGEFAAGPPGPSNNTRVSLAAMKGAAITDKTSLYDGSLWTWTEGDYTGQADDLNIVKADSTALSVGAWVRQRADNVQYKVAVAQAVPRPVAAFIEDQALSPEEVGAKGDGTSDDTLALQRALATGRNIKLSPGKTYLLKSRLLVDTPNVAFGGGGTIKIAPDWDFASDTDGGGTHMRAIFVEAENVSFDGLIFDLSDAPEGTAVENGVIWSTAPYTSVTNCQFVDNPKGTCIWGLSAWLNVQGNIFKNCSGAAFARGRGPVISNNIIRDAFDAAIAINGPPCIGAAIVGNTIMNDAGRLIPAMIAVEEAASDWTIVGNTLTGANGGGIWCGNVLLSDPADGGVIAGNSIRADLFDGTRPASANPATMIYISPFYINWIIDANKVRGLPSGNTDSCLVLVAATGGVVSGNFFDGMGAAGIAGHLRVLAGTRGITISNNKSRAPDGRHVLFGPGDYGGVPCTFVGGDFQGGAEAINSELNAASMSNFKLYIQDINAAEGVASVVNAATALGDRATFLNAGAWRFPHRIGVQTVMFGNAMPSNGGAQPFQNGDRVHALTPASGGTLGWVRVPGGTPWVSVGNAA